MNITLWIITIIAGGGVRGRRDQPCCWRRGRSTGRWVATQHWVDDFGDGHLTAIGTIKLVGAIGLVLPVAVGVVPVLTPVAACGLALFMAGAATTRFRRSEWPYMAGDVVFLGVFAFLAWGWFTLPVT